MSKIYCGNGKKVHFDDGGSLIAVSLDLDVLIKNNPEFGFDAKRGRKIKIKVCESREVDQYGNTHYVEIDQWKPDGNRSRTQGTAAPQPPGAPQMPPAQAPPKPPGSSFEDDIPF